MTDRAFLLGTAERKQLDDDGYCLVPDALSAAQVAELVAAIDRCIGPDGKGREHNRAAILAKDPAFLALVDLPTIFPKVCQHLGWNIWVNHSHYNVNPPEKVDKDFVYGWHRDGGVIHYDLFPSNTPAPPAYMKVGFYLTDLHELGRGQTYVVPGSHRAPPNDPRMAQLLARKGPWSKAGVPDDAVPILCKAGSAIMFHNRLVHSQRSLNSSGLERRAIFIQWAYRWMQPVDPMDVAQLDGQVTDPIRRQLLGLEDATPFDDPYGQGRSRRYFPSPKLVPVRAYYQDVLGLPANEELW